jgi:hypothetical protein
MDCEKNPDEERALVVFSGGQDSTTCLYWALDRFGATQVEALSFDYGQRHRIELTAAKRIAKYAGVPHRVLPIDTFRLLGGNSLTDDRVAVPSLSVGLSFLKSGLDSPTCRARASASTLFCGPRYFSSSRASTPSSSTKAARRWLTWPSVGSK